MAKIPTINIELQDLGEKIDINHIRELIQAEKPAGWWCWMNLCALSCGAIKTTIPFFAHDAYVTSWEDLSMLRLAKL